MYIRLLILSILLLLFACNNTENNMQVNTPFQVAIDAMGKDFQIEISNLNISQELSAVGSPNSAKVTIEQFSLLDDSISAIKDIFVLSFDHGQWIIQESNTLYKCYHGREPNAFSSALCK